MVAVWAEGGLDQRGFAPNNALVTLDKAEIRRRARTFAKSWEGATSERSESQSFWNDFFDVFGVARRRVAVYEAIAKRSSTGRSGSVDLLMPGEMAIEQKSAGETLAKAMDIQLVDYLPSLPPAEHPWLLVACDFRRFAWRNLETGTKGTFPLEDLPDHLEVFWWLAGYQVEHRTLGDEVAVNLKATDLLAQLYDALLISGYPEGDLREWITRVLFCLFADDAGVFDRGAFHSYVALHTAPDGHDVGDVVARVFKILDTPPEHRPASLDEDLRSFTYVNGDLFANDLWPIPGNAAIRSAILDACRFDWSVISPAIFGSLFQNVMTPRERRQLGAHYTTEQNILRTIQPLFLDDLNAELTAANTAKKLQSFHDKLARLTFFDPACGCGNFLVIAYREIRHLETETLRQLAEKRRRAGQRTLHLDLLCKVRVDQFFGIEIEEFPARIARTALYLIDHLENRSVSAEFGEYFVRFPIPAAPHIAIGNAARTDWGELLTPQDASFVFGNPPFVGKKVRTPDQQEDMALVFAGARGAATLDYVACWYEQAARYAAGRPIRFAFVSTNSITQGEQVPVLWKRLADRGCTIGFAHRTFAWTSEARGKAHVHCVIIGFTFSEWLGKRVLFDYPSPTSEPVTEHVRRINPYLADAPTVFVEKRRAPLARVPRAHFGSMPNDDGNFLLDEEEANEVRTSDPIAARYIREIVSTHQMIHGEQRWCLWLADAQPNDIRTSPELRRRVAAVRAYREASNRPTTRELARTPYLFGEIRQPDRHYLCVPRHASELRMLIPMRFYGPTAVASDSTVAIPDADHYLFGVLQSAMFTAWVRAVGGRIKSDLRFSVEMVYNTFPFIEPTAAQRDEVGKAAEAVLAAREATPGSLADLYDPDSTPAQLVEAHRRLDRAVDKAFAGRRRTALNEADRLALLFARYEQLATAEQLPAFGGRQVGRGRH